MDYFHGCFSEFLDLNSPSPRLLTLYGKELYILLKKGSVEENLEKNLLNLYNGTCIRHGTGVTVLHTIRQRIQSSQAIHTPIQKGARMEMQCCLLTEKKKHRRRTIDDLRTDMFK